MEAQYSAWEIINQEIDRIRSVVAEYPEVGVRIEYSLRQIRDAAEAALPCPVIPAISMKEYVDDLPSAAELHATVLAQGGRYVFHGYTFWLQPDGDGWSLTNPIGMDDVMLLHGVEDFEKFLQQLRLGITIGIGA